MQQVTRGYKKNNYTYKIIKLIRIQKHKGYYLFPQPQPIHINIQITLFSQVVFQEFLVVQNWQAVHDHEVAQIRNASHGPVELVNGQHVLAILQRRSELNQELGVLRQIGELVLVGRQLTLQVILTNAEHAEVLVADSQKVVCVRLELMQVDALVHFHIQNACAKLFVHMQVRLDESLLSRRRIRWALGNGHRGLIVLQNKKKDVI